MCRQIIDGGIQCASPKREHHCDSNMPFHPRNMIPQFGSVAIYNFPTNIHVCMAMYMREPIHTHTYRFSKLFLACTHHCVRKSGKLSKHMKECCWRENASRYERDGK